MKAVIIGAGYISRFHARAIQATPKVELAGICDLSAVVAQSVAEEHGIDHWFTNYQQMLSEISPDVTHITTPISSHVKLAIDALRCGSHVLVEKPIAPTWDDWTELRSHAEDADRWVIEDHNYLFNQPVHQLTDLVCSGDFGDIVHVDVTFCLDLSGSVFSDRNLRHETLDLPGGAIHDFLPHMAYLTTALIGGHERVSTIWLKRDPDSVLPYDEFRAQVQGEKATAALAFCSHSQPDGFWLTVYGTRMQSRINLLENRITTVRQRGGPGPLMHLGNGLQEGLHASQAACKSLVRKLSGGPASYDGLFELVRRLYNNLSEGHAPPVTMDDVDVAQRLVHDLAPSEKNP